MNDVQKYQGVIPAFYACYDETGEISPERVRTLTRHLAEKGVKGVYVDNGYSVKFKTVDIIYEGENYYLSRLNYTGEEQLNIFDKLIASKTELYDGMPLSDL